jgi:hypothetical protein
VPQTTAVNHDDKPRFSPAARTTPSVDCAAHIGTHEPALSPVINARNRRSRRGGRSRAAPPSLPNRATQVRPSGSTFLLGRAGGVRFGAGSPPGNISDAPLTGRSRACAGR